MKETDEIKKEIRKLNNERNAFILADVYQTPFKEKFEKIEKILWK